jgi:hypothetical protein
LEGFLMQIRPFLLVAVCLGAWAAESFADEPVPASPEPSPPSREQIAGLVADLDSDRYETREAATRALVEAGAAAVKPLGEAAAAGSLELGVRAVRVLERLYTSEDTEVVTAAEEVLESLAASKNRSIAARAEFVFSLHEDVGERVAVAKIRSLGGIPKYYDSRFEARLVEPNPTEGEEPQPVEILILGNEWKGGDEGLRYVKRLPQLKSLYVVRGTGVSEKALNDLQSILPDLVVDHRGPAYLGVSMQNTTRGCLVKQVSPNSAAQKAGLLDNDTMLQFGDVTVTRSEDVIEAIKGLKPGDKVKVLLEREGKTLTVEVVMGGWAME